MKQADSPKHNFVAEWHALYGDDGLTKMLFDMLENFYFYESGNGATEQGFNNYISSKWDEVVSTLSYVTEQTKGPGPDPDRPHPPRFPMITIVVTPSTHENALNSGFTVSVVCFQLEH